MEQGGKQSSFLFFSVSDIFLEMWKISFQFNQSERLGPTHTNRDRLSVRSDPTSYNLA